MAPMPGTSDQSSGQCGSHSLLASDWSLPWALKQCFALVPVSVPVTIFCLVSAQTLWTLPPLCQESDKGYMHQTLIPSRYLPHRLTYPVPIDQSEDTKIS